MADLALDIASWVLLMAGAFLVLTGALGLVRMPDFYTRMHPAGITDTLGARADPARPDAPGRLRPGRGQAVPDRRVPVLHQPHLDPCHRQCRVGHGPSPHGNGRSAAPRRRRRSQRRADNSHRSRHRYRAPAVPGRYRVRHHAPRDAVLLGHAVRRVLVRVGGAVRASRRGGRRLHRGRGRRGHLHRADAVDARPHSPARSAAGPVRACCRSWSCS